MERDIQIFREGFKRGCEYVASLKPKGKMALGFYQAVDTGRFDFMFTNRDFAMDAAHLERTWEGDGPIGDSL